MRNILVIDDHKLIFGGLKSEMPEEYELYYAYDSESARNIVREHTISTAIVDISLGKENGFDLAKDLKGIVPEIFFLSMHKTPFYIQKVLNEGYRGYFLKDDSLDLLIEAICFPEKRGFWVSDEVESILNDYETNEFSLYETLTAREQQIFRLLAEGVGYKEIAFKLNVSPKTVSVHRDNVMRKMKLDHQTELIKQAVKLRIITI